MVTSIAIKAFLLVVLSLPFTQAQTIHYGDQVVGMNSSYGFGVFFSTNIC